MRALLASLVLSVLFVGCGDDTVPATPDGGPTDAGIADAALDASPSVGDLARDFCAPIADVVCSSAATCGCGAAVPGGVLDHAACVTAYAARCVMAWQPFVTGALIDAAAAADCIAIVRARTPACARPDPSLLFAVCAPFAVAPAALGETCTSPYCAGGAGSCAGGTCVARGAAGTACSDMFACATGLACNGGVCAEFHDAYASCTWDLDCAAPLRCIGEVCAPLGAASATCVDASGCAIGLACNAGTCAAPSSATCATSADCGNRAECGGVRTCLARGVVGQGCTEDGNCEPSLYCQDDTQLCAARPGAGQPCARGVLCAPGLGCDPMSTCAPAPTSGQPCALAESGPFLCAPGLGCDPMGSCAALPGEGAACAGDYLCADGLGCDFTPAGSFCIVPRGEGGACESDRSCATGFHCGPGTCTADLPAGSPCSVGNECAGVCGIGPSGGLECRDAPAEGDPCLFSDECPGAFTCRAATLSCLPEICREL